MLEVQRAVLGLVAAAGDRRLDAATPSWLRRPGRDECAGAWPVVVAIYRSLTGGELAEMMPTRERRLVDAVLEDADGRRRIVEVDERQHFTPARAATLDEYPADVATAFDRVEWRRRSASLRKAPGGGFARPCPPLFPEAGGRHLQRAFRDALADLVPPEHGWAPTLRIAHWEVEPWLEREDAAARMVDLLDRKLAEP